MKKILSLLTGGLIKDVGDVIDKLTTTDEERLAAKQKVQELLEKADQDAQTQITERWKVDMQSDSFLSKRRIYTDFSVFINHGVWRVFCWAYLGKSKKIQQ